MRPPSDFGSVAARVREARAALEQRKGAQRALERRREELLRRREDAQARAEQLRKVRALFEMAGETARETARLQTERMGTEALQAVFGSRLALAVEMGESRGRPVAEILVRTQPDAGPPFVGHPLDAHGGGVADVVSVALRFVLLEGATGLGGPALLDEPGKHVSADLAPRLAAFLATVSREFGRQILMVTHNQDLAEVADAAYTVRLDEAGRSIVERIR